MEIYQNDRSLLDEVPSLGRGIFRQAALGGPRPQARQNVYEICYVDRGSAEWWSDDTLYQVGPGTLFINWPGEWHGGDNAMLHPCEVFWVQIHLDRQTPLPTLSPALSDDIVQRFHSMTCRFFPASDPIRGYFQQILDEHRQPERPYAALSARSALHGLLAGVIRDHDRQAATPQSDGIRAALAWMDAHLAEHFTVEQAAQAANMSTGYFHRRFVEEIGYPPGEYRMRRRIHVAKHHLRENHQTITDIGYKVGFSSSQYFATVFKKLTGLTPGEYRERVCSQIPGSRSSPG